jgi:DNA-binding beta-propeller fold protein YncE
MSTLFEKRRAVWAAPERQPGRVLLLAAAVFAGVVAVAASRAFAADAPLRLEKSISIPEVPIWPYADHMAIDLAHHRLFATPQRAKSVAVIDLRTDQVSRMIPGLGNPHGPYYSEALNRLFVSNGTPGDVKVFDGSNYALIGTISLAPGADGLVYDPHDRLIYVANGMGNVNGKGTHTGRASIAVIDPVRMKKVADIPITTGGIEGLAVDPEKQLLYVSLPDAAGIGVVDLTKRELVATWSVPHDSEPFSLAVFRGRLYAACRASVGSTDVNGTLFVLDTTNGRSIAKLPIGGWVDGISVDPKRNRIYLSSGMGYIDTYTIGTNDTYQREPRVDTALLGKTSLYSSKLDRLYVAVPQVGDGPSRVMVFRPSP